MLVVVINLAHDSQKISVRGQVALGLLDVGAAEVMHERPQPRHRALGHLPQRSPGSTEYKPLLDC